MAPRLDRDVLAADPDAADGERLRVERDDVGAGTGGDTSVFGSADRACGIAGGGARSGG